MRILKPRTRLVYFRLSEEEIEKFTDMCHSEGARSMSDLIRTALDRMTRDCASVPEDLLMQRLELIDRMMEQLKERIIQIDHALEQVVKVRGGGRSALRREQ